ncbi:hypothetical protein X739_33625 [Mesorhizobium sp. LNHC220B00]|nr:hypothetical protein X739_33625 [Mesorhizobium sp. LNHC220B00]
MAVGNELGRRAVAIIGDRFVAVPVDRLVDVAGEFHCGRNHLDHLTHPALQALRCGIAERVAMDAGELRHLGHLHSKRLRQALRRYIRCARLLQAVDKA